MILLYFALEVVISSNVPSRLFFKYAWKWSSVPNGYNDESLFYVCSTFRVSFWFKLHETHDMSVFRSECKQLSLSTSFVDRLYFDTLFFKSSAEPWLDIPASFNLLIHPFYWHIFQLQLKMYVLLVVLFVLLLLTLENFARNFWPNKRIE